jgi:oxygen-dependent protoporphyrinogen oxidase
VNYANPPLSKPSVNSPVPPVAASALPVAVIGGGITGLSAAWELCQRGVPVVVFEARSQPGGVMASVRDRDWLVETGPNTLFENSPAITAFLKSLGLDTRRLVASPEANTRYVVRNGRPAALPGTPLAFFTSPFLSVRTKLGVLAEPFRRRGPADRDESVAEFVDRRLGREFLDFVVNPFVAGVYAGDPAALSVRHAFPKLHALERDHGSLIRGALRRRTATAGPKGSMVSFPDGLAEIPRALAQKLGSSLRLNHAVTAVRRKGAAWQVVFDAGDGPVAEDFASVICALPPDALARLPILGVPEAAKLSLLGEVPQPAVASVFLGFRREDVTHPLDGFGLLAPAVEKRRILGTLFSSTLFPGRAPEGYVALTTFVGGTRQPELCAQDDAALVAMVQGELADLLGVHGAPVITRVQRWPRAIAQYVVGFQKFKNACYAAEAAAPGLFLGGPCCDGVSLSNCIGAGRRLADAASGRFTLS